MSLAAEPISVGLLTGGDDRSYALGLTLALADEGICVDFVGSDQLDAPELHDNERIRFLNLRGDQTTSAGFMTKAMRLTRYYCRLLRYALKARPRVFHILWNNKFEFLDRTLLMIYYKLCGRRIVLTVHNVNAAARDERDGWLNRLTLRAQYHLSDHLFVHTPAMKEELRSAFSVSGDDVSVIPFGINNTAPNTMLTPQQARQRLGLRLADKVALFFGQIAPYKGVEYLLKAAAELQASDPDVCLVIAGKVKRGAESYWRELEARFPASDRLVMHIRHVPDSEIEMYFKAADVLVLPYVRIFQSGVPFLSYGFGLPVIATDVGALRDDVMEGQTGLVCRARDSNALAGSLRAYFGSDMYRNLEERRRGITRWVNEEHSWTRVAAITRAAYERVLEDRR
jgi:glycosyltransferase involved in cell wall biosynthesis